MTPRILVVEDDPQVASLLRRSLEAEGFRVITLAEGGETVREASRLRPDLLVLDLDVAGVDGFEICRRLRAEPLTSRLPMLILGGRGEKSAPKAVMDGGSSTYLSRPFRLPELAARARVLIRRGEFSPPSTILRAGGIELDLERRTVSAGGDPEALASHEFVLLRALMGSKGRVLSREHLQELVSGRESAAEIESGTVDAYVVSLRSKLGRRGDVIRVVRGIGYRFQATPEWIRGGPPRELSE